MGALREFKARARADKVHEETVTVTVIDDSGSQTGKQEGSQTKQRGIRRRLFAEGGSEELGGDGPGVAESKTSHVSWGLPPEKRARKEEKNEEERSGESDTPSRAATASSTAPANPFINVPVRPMRTVTPRPTWESDPWKVNIVYM